MNTDTHSSPEQRDHLRRVAEARVDHLNWLIICLQPQRWAAMTPGGQEMIRDEVVKVLRQLLED